MRRHDRRRTAPPRVRVAAVVAIGLIGAAFAGVPAAVNASPATSNADGTQPAVVVEDGAVREVDLTAGQIAAIEADPTAAVVPRGHTVGPAIALSVPTVGAPTMWAQGQRGAGRVIVVIDTGVGSTFGGTLVGQACFAANATGTVGYCGPAGNVLQAFDSTCFTLGVCTGGDVLDAAAARPCPSPSTPSACAHGTAVAAVAARHEPTPGVAPDAGVYAIRVFNPQGTFADLADIVLALDHVRQLVDAGLPVAAVNLSVSTVATFVGACDNTPSLAFEADAYRDVFNALLNRGVPTTVASGNSGSTTGIGFPACMSNAVSVGATDLDDDIALFGNRGPGLDLMAPGARQGTSPLTIPGSAFSSWAGTSFAAPHVAGAFALLDEAYPKASVAQRLALLVANGVAVPESGRTYRRLQLAPGQELLRGGRLLPDREKVVAGSRAAVGDLDGDGRGDLIVHGPGAAPDGIYFGRPTWDLVRTARTVSGTYRPIIGNFRGAPRAGPGAVAEETLFYAAGAANDPLWQVSPTRTISTDKTQVTATYTSFVGDLDGDGWDDIVWYAPGTSAGEVWFGGAAAFTVVARPVVGSYRVAVGDFDCDGRDEVYWHAPGSQVDRRWDVAADRSVTSQAAEIAGSYRVLVANLDGDSSGGHPCDDLVLHAPGPPVDHIVYGGPSGAVQNVAIGGDYRPFAGDLNGDGRDEVVWYAAGAASDVVWSTSAARLRTSVGMQVAGSYQPLVADLDGDGASDVIWYAPGPSVPVWWGVPGPP